MVFWQNLLRILDTGMEEPLPYGWFHLLSCALCIVATVLLCMFLRKGDFNRQRKVVLITSIVVIILEVYKQINFSFTYTDGVAFDYQWYSFPWQFCSTPMYVGLLAGLTKKGKFHDCLCAYLATFAVFAGVAVMLYPTTVFVEAIGINIQTMVCHSSMITLGVYLYASGHVKLEHKTVLKAIPVFAAMVSAAVIMNEIAHASGLLERETFNMFFVSPYCEPSLPVYSTVQGLVPFPWCLVLYIAGFTAAAYIILLVAMGIGKLSKRIQNKKAIVS